MSYATVMSRISHETKEDECIHGLDKVSCGYCTGTSFVKSRIKSVVEVDSELVNRYEKLKEQYANFQEVWNEDEFFVVYANIKDVKGTKAELTMIYQTAIELQRTIGAVRWAISHLFSGKEYHRGKTVIEFRKMFGLDKGESSG